ncbi:hypothetical protein PUN28_002293 [Cardiocondyla obscurior]|uniref:Secreted protein n=1 Tax=Cardiocondyla obscurior TaxID=286306 RepID=A0AAW2GTC1_9HYME
MHVRMFHRLLLCICRCSSNLAFHFGDSCIFVEKYFTISISTIADCFNRISSTFTSSVISRYRTPCSQPRFSILRVHPSSSALPARCLDTVAT